MLELSICVRAFRIREFTSDFSARLSALEKQLEGMSVICEV